MGDMCVINNSRSMIYHVGININIQDYRDVIGVTALPMKLKVD